MTPLGKEIRENGRYHYATEGDPNVVHKRLIAEGLAEVHEVSFPFDAFIETANFVDV
jgi:hypothetical protein